MEAPGALQNIGLRFLVSNFQLDGKKVAKAFEEKLKDIILDLDMKQMPKTAS